LNTSGSTDNKGLYKLAENVMAPEDRRVFASYDEEIACKLLLKMQCCTEYEKK
jgi:hypothetical protein